MAKPRRVRVNSGPNEKMSLRMEERINDLIAIGVGIVITMAADTNRKTQIRPEMWGPESGIRKLNYDFSWFIIHVVWKIQSYNNQVSFLHFYWEPNNDGQHICSTKTVDPIWQK